MGDVRTFWKDFGGHWQLDGPALADDDGLETAVILSLFTDRVADAGEPGVAPTARRGWWGDAYADQAGDRVGSRLWLLARAKRTPDVLARAELYTREALAWLVADGVAESVAVQAEAQGDCLALAIAIRRSGAPVVQFRFDSFWSAQ